MIRHLGIVTLVIVALADCSPTQSSLSPTAPTGAVRAAASTAQAPGGHVCEAYEGRALGACRALFAQHCEVEGVTSPTCDHLVENFRDATGVLPPFIGRFYVSRDPEVCVVIRWSCQDSFTPFIDSTGCGCQRIP